MSRLAWIKLGLAAVGVILWGYGARTDDPRLRLAGMVVLALAVLLRLLPRGLRDRLDSAHGPGPDTNS